MEHSFTLPHLAAAANIILSSTVQLMKITVLAESPDFSTLFTLSMLCSGLEAFLIKVLHTSFLSCLFHMISLSSLEEFFLLLFNTLL